MMGKLCPILSEAFRSPKDSAQVRILPEMPKTSLGSAGGTEKENQDRVAVIEYVADDRARDFRLFAVADGVGGLSAGGQCAEAALAALTEKMLLTTPRDIGVRLGDAFRFANQHVFSVFNGDSATTLSVLAVSSSGRTVAGSVGDSRIYRYSTTSSPSKLEQLTEDDTIGNQVALAKGQTPRQTSAGGVLGQLTQAVGSGPEIFPTVNSVRHTDGDEYLLTSDGFHSAGRENILRVLGNSSRPLQAIERLTRMARWLGTKDDISSVFVASMASANDTARHLRLPGGLVRIHALHGTLSVTGIDAILQATTATKSSERVDNAPKRRKRRSGKKSSRSAKQKNSARHTNNASAKSDQDAEAKDAPPQQELEINYIGNDKD